MAGSGTRAQSVQLTALRTHPLEKQVIQEFVRLIDEGAPHGEAAEPNERGENDECE
jgi:hypothetical protein